jgi:Zn-dependent protease with chaperone function
VGITGRERFARWFSTHPSLDERIEALRRAR